MKKKLSILLVAISIILIVSCKKEKTNSTLNLKNSDYFILGNYAGECSGDCARFYKIENNQLFPDQNDYIFPIDSLKFSTTSLENNKYNIAIEALNNFPIFLLENKNIDFGCPDCYDQGGIYIILKKDGKVSFWNIDTNTNVQPAEIKNYIASLNTILSALQ